VSVRTASTQAPQAAPSRRARDGAAVVLLGALAVGAGIPAGLALRSAAAAVLDHPSPAHERALRAVRADAVPPAAAPAPSRPTPTPRP
jgi:hypothetical protein